VVLGWHVEEWQPVNEVVWLVPQYQAMGEGGVMYADVLAEVLLQVHSNVVEVAVGLCSEEGVMQDEHKLWPPGVSQWYDHVVTASCGLLCLRPESQSHC